MDRANRQLRTTLLLAGDIGLLYFSLWVTLRLRYGGTYDAPLWQQHFWPFTVVFGAWIIIFAISELYDLSAGSSRSRVASRLAGALAVAGTVAATYFYLGYNRLFTLRPQKVLMIMLVITFLMLFLWRVALMAALRSPRLARRVLFVGNHPIIPQLIAELRAKPQLGFTPTAWLQADGEPAAPNAEIPKYQNIDLPVYHRPNELQALCQRHQVDLITSSINPHHHEELLRELLACLPLRIDFSDLSHFYERITGKVPVEAIEQVWFLENLREGTKRLYEIFKRMLDVTLATVSLIIVLPFWLPLYVLVKRSSPGPFLFTQTRVGQAGKKFTAMKIRTMVVDAEKTGPQWASPNDARVTRFGHFLRATRLDEIPQLYNVLRGEMSLIGPRPERPEFIEHLRINIPFYEERLLAKPGLTGWAQVNFPYGASEHDALEKLQYDLFYIKHRSLGLDLTIALRTIGTIISRSGR
ncbi:MAG: sugar transferase [Patescibacteria group bacterium]|nr:sugar transferase [Patescibacteria group bacterium]